MSLPIFEPTEKIQNQITEMVENIISNMQKQSDCKELLACAGGPNNNNDDGK